jgi:hypothetical protein
VKTVSSGVGFGSFKYSIGAGVTPFGVTGWRVKNTISPQFQVGRGRVLGPDQSHRQGGQQRQHVRLQPDGAPFNDANGGSHTHRRTLKGDQ